MKNYFLPFVLIVMLLLYSNEIAAKSLEIDIPEDSLIVLQVSSNNYLYLTGNVFRLFNFRIHHSLYTVSPKYQYFGGSTSLYKDIKILRLSTQTGFTGHYYSGIYCYWFRTGTQFSSFRNKLNGATYLQLIKTSDGLVFRPQIGLSYSLFPFCDMVFEYVPKLLYHPEDIIINIGVNLYKNGLSGSVYLQTSSEVNKWRHRTILRLSIKYSFLTPRKVERMSKRED